MKNECKSVSIHKAPFLHFTENSTNLKEKVIQEFSDISLKQLNWNPGFVSRTDLKM